jgi:hypothetical protein
MQAEVWAKLSLATDNHDKSSQVTLPFGWCRDRLDLAYNDVRSWAKHAACQLLTEVSPRRCTARVPPRGRLLRFRRSIGHFRSPASPGPCSGWLSRGRREQEASYFSVIVWRDQADHAAQSLSKGSRVVVVGRLQQRSWTAEDGSARSVVEVVAEELGPSLRWAAATTTRATSSSER